MKRAEGKYIAVMDGDDIAMAERLEKQYQYLEKDPDLIALGIRYKLSPEGIEKEVPMSHENFYVSLLSVLKYDIRDLPLLSNIKIS